MALTFSHSLRSIFYGTIVHTPSLRELAILPRTLLATDLAGKIVVLRKNVDETEIDALLATQPDRDAVTVHRLLSRQFLFPGLIDTHIHAPQYVFTGTGGDHQLLPWLEKYTFPHESKFADLEHAKDVYTKCVRRLLRNGTTTAAYFASLDVSAGKILADVMHKLGQRGWVGKVCMDANSPDYYCEEGDEAIAGTEEIIRYVRSLDTDLIRPCVTPRFAVSCTKKTLHSLGNLAQREDVPIQSHLSENRGEIELVRTLFPNSRNYASVYDDAGLMTSKTIMAHCVHLTAEERELIKARGSGISHCAGSNFALRSGVLNVRRLLEEGIPVGLGTDVSGGYSLSILAALRDASTASRITQVASEEVEGGRVWEALTLPELLYLATQGGANIMGLGEEVGSFSLGKSFDALCIDLEGGKAIDLFSYETPRDLVERWVYLGDDRSVRKVWVAGALVHSAE